MARKLSRSRIAYGSPQTRRFDSCSSTRHLRRQKPRQLFATAGVSAEKGDMILERTGKGQPFSLNCFMPLDWRLNQRMPRPHKAATPVTEL